MEVIIKFYDNPSFAEGEAPLMSRTLGKVAIVGRAYMDRVKVNPRHNPMPSSQEFWKVHIIKELRRGERAGCYLVQPLEKVDENDLLHLAPGMYVMEHRDGVLYVTPNPEYQGQACIMPLDFKRMYLQEAGAYSMLVDVSKPKPATVFIDRKSRHGDNPYRGH